jgi:DsbC/DsbD-like thiol-disulfide interchange protein
MKMKKPLIAIFSVFAALACAQENIPPTVKVTLPKTVVSGKSVKGTIKVKFAEGLHGYQNPPTRDWMVPVTVSTSTKGAVLAKLNYPKGIMKESAGDRVAVYEGEVTIPFELKVTGKKGNMPITFNVRYQQCNETGCYAPTTVSAKTTITVK